MDKLDKEKFAEILFKIKITYLSLNEMAKTINITTAYLSKLIRLMYVNPPSPKILRKIADGSRGVTNYSELMEICGYIKENEIIVDKNKINLIVYS